MSTNVDNSNIGSGSGLATVNEVPPADGRWLAKSGPELTRLLRREFPESPEVRQSLEQSAVHILSKCVEPNGPISTNTGLVVGYVQSGKTLSFTSVAAAAQDNGFRLVVLVAGSTHILANQSRDRLIRDLDVTGGALTRPWRHFHNPEAGQTDMIRTALEAWNREGNRKKTVLITILKNRARIDKLASVLRAFPPELLGAALIVDDEADQVSLNNAVKKGKQSATYRAILELRDTLPRHTYLQYTATPQANIFIPLIDLLSPDFCEVLDPGEGYVGGRLVFKERCSELVRDIPPSEIGNSVDPPKSLFKALKVYLVGVAEGLLLADQELDISPENRSMLVHPSRLVDDHTLYCVRVNAALSRWASLLKDPSDPERDELLLEFREAHADLQQHSGYQRPEFNAVSPRLPEAIEQAVVQPVNSLADIASWDDEWKQHYAWVLVGGQKLDRGFTIEGLTVTYMPRGRGVGYADTIQQRGRFFGYKLDYLDLCRVYLEPDVRRAFEVYVESEESMRAFLRANSRRGALKRPDLRRQFQMDRTLQPTRRSILLDAPVHRRLSARGWFAQGTPHASNVVAEENRQAIDDFVRAKGLTINLEKDQSSWLRDPEKALDTHFHRVARSLNAAELYNGLLSSLVMADERDGADWQVALALVEQFSLQNPDAPAGIAWIRPNIRTARGTKKSGEIRQLFMGAYPKKSGEVYAGDDEVHVGELTLQVHELDIHEGQAKGSRQPKWEGVTTLALWLAPEFNADFITQDQGVRG